MTPTRQARIDWLLAHPDVWAGMPETYSRMCGHCGHFETWQQIVAAWKRLGLLSRKTHWRDVGMIGLVQAARRQRREGKR